MAIPVGVSMASELCCVTNKSPKLYLDARASAFYQHRMTAARGQNIRTSNLLGPVANRPTAWATLVGGHTFAFVSLLRQYAVSSARVNNQTLYDGNVLSKAYQIV